MVLVVSQLVFSDRLIDLDGFKEISFGADLRDGGYYVACGRERFKNCEYGMSLLTLPPKHQMNRYNSRATVNIPCRTT